MSPTSCLTAPPRNCCKSIPFHQSFVKHRQRRDSNSNFGLGGFQGCQSPTTWLRWLSPCTQEVAMTNPLYFDALRAMLPQRAEQWPDCRKGRNTQYRMSDAALGAFGIFFTQSPSFLEYQ